MTSKSAKLVAYFRVSTQQQGESGLGLEAQKAAVVAYAESHGLEIVAEFIEIESGKDDNRPELLKAILKAKASKASLIVKTQCRLARKVVKALTIIESLPVIIADSPNMTKLELQLRAIIDEEEARRISERTKAALKAAKAKGMVLGKPENLTPEAQKLGALGNVRAAKERTRDILPTILRLRGEGLGMKAIAERLNAEGRTTAAGGAWHATQIQRVLKRQEMEAAQ